MSIMQGFNPFSKSDWDDVGDTIKGGFESAGKEIKEAFEKGVKFLGKTFHDAKDLVEEAFTKVTECVSVVGLGTKWASKKAAYETAKATLEAAKELQMLDPRLVSLQAAEETAKAALEAGKKSLDAAQLSAKAFSEVLKKLSAAAGKGINIKSMSFEGYMSKLLASAKGPRITINAVVFGQNIKKDVEVDFSKPAAAAKKIMRDILKEMKEFKDLIVDIVD